MPGDFIVAAFTIFFLRVVDISLYTLRVMTVVRGVKGYAMLFAFFQAFVYINAARIVLSDLGNPMKILGYAAGYATGLVVGMYIESHLAMGYSHLRIISSRRGLAIAERLRNAGYGVTEVHGMGKDGAVVLLECDVLRKDAKRVQQQILETDPQAFITSQAVRPLQRGFWHR